MKIMYKAVSLYGLSFYDNKTKWEVGQVVRCPNPDVRSNEPCGRGIHCSSTLLHAVGYQRGPARYFKVIPLDEPLGSDETKSRFSAVRVKSELSQAEQDGLTGFKLWEANHPVNPLLLPCRLTPTERLSLLKQWASVRASVWASVWASVRDSVGDSVGASVWDSVWNPVGNPVGTSVEDSVWTSAGDSSVRDSAGNSVWDSVTAYIGGLFPDITQWRNAKALGPDPWRPLLDLWYGGCVPSFDGNIWRLHAGPKAEIVLAIDQQELRGDHYLD